MAPFSHLLLAVVAILHAAADATTSDVDGGRQTRYHRVFSFGDSLTDTGNVLRLSPTTGGGPATRPPYGETFFRRPTGRASDGRLIIDFIVEALGVPQQAPYLAGKTAAADFRRGVNFAVGGATALAPHFFETRGLEPFVPVSLSNQTSWFRNVLRVLGSVHEQREIMSTSLFLVGEIGVNDYFIGLNGNRTVADVNTFVPHVVSAIRSVATDVIAAGAPTLVVPGMIPLGCEPSLLTLYKGIDAGGYDYDDPVSGCIAGLNDLAQLHNLELRRMLSGLRRAHPGTTVVYADLYQAITDIIASPRKYGFGSRPLVACCGGAAFCGSAGAAVCADPSAYVSWDGVHFTEAANRQIACAVLEGSHSHGAGASPLSSSSTWATMEAWRRRIGCV